MKISTKQQEYIEVIYELSQTGEHSHAHAKNIAERLHNKMASVTDVMRTLSEMGLVNYEVRRAITLTPAGLQIAQELQLRHKTLANFFKSVLGTSSERAQTFACEIEHLIDDQLTERFADFVEFISKHEDLLNEFHRCHPPAEKPIE